MASGTQTRAFLRLLEASGSPLYVIGPQGDLVYLSSGCADWLGVDLELLLNRRCVAGSPVSDEAYDRLAAALSPPTGLSKRGTASLRIQPPAIGEIRPKAIEVRFTRAGNHDKAITIAVGGTFDDRVIDQEIRDAVALRSQLDRWRRKNSEFANLVTAGQSPAVRRLRRRIRVASSTRIDFCVCGPRGCGSESIARNIHQASSANEPLIAVDGSLMDPELLDAVLAPMIHPLTESPQSLATALVRDLDETPPEAQRRLVEIWQTFGGRFRMIGLCSRQPAVLSETANAKSDVSASLLVDDISPEGISVDLWEILTALTVTMEPLSERVEDLPLLAAAILDRRRALGEGTAERFSRAALDAFVIYPWPEDYQELEEAIRHAIRTSRSETIGIEQLPLAIRSYRPGSGSVAAKRLNISLDDALSRFELRIIQQALDATNGNRAEAARRLGISRARLLRRIDSLKAD